MWLAFVVCSSSGGGGSGGSGGSGSMKTGEVGTQEGIHSFLPTYVLVHHFFWE